MLRHIEVQRCPTSRLARLAHSWCWVLPYSKRVTLHPREGCRACKLLRAPATRTPEELEAAGGAAAPLLPGAALAAPGAALSASRPSSGSKRSLQRCRRSHALWLASSTCAHSMPAALTTRVQGTAPNRTITAQHHLHGVTDFCHSQVYTAPRYIITDWRRLWSSSAPTAGAPAWGPSC